MKKKKLPIFGLLAINLFLWTSSLVWAVPLSLDQNIKAVVANKADLSKGFEFVVIGDSRDGAEVYNRLLNQAKAFKPLFILNTGDLVREGQAFEYESYAKQIAPFDIPILHLPGNHDVRYGPENYRKYVGEDNWYFDLEEFRVIGLDNATGKFSEEALNFARKTMITQKICLVAFHIPPAIGRWSAHGMISDQKGGNGGQMMDLIKEAKVPMVFLGHIHLYDEMDINETKFVISAGGGAKLYDKYNFGRPEHGFVLVKVRPQGITHEWVPLD